MSNSADACRHLMLAVVGAPLFAPTWHVISSGHSMSGGACALNRVKAVLLVGLDAFSRADVAKNRRLKYPVRAAVLCPPINRQRGPTAELPDRGHRFIRLHSQVTQTVWSYIHHT
jgi:hypothetical protein